MKIFTLLSAATLSLCSCSINPAATISTGKDSNGNTTAVEASSETSIRKEQTEKFDKLQIDGLFECVYTQNNENKYTVTITGPKNIVDLYDLKVRNGQLRIDLKKGYRIKKYKTNDVLIEISSPDLTKLSNDGVGKVTVENLATNNFEMDATGVGSTEIHNLKAQTIDLNNSGVGNVDIRLEAANVVLENSGVGKISASGKAKTADMENNGVGSIEAGSLICETLEAENSGVGSIEAHATQYAEYKNSGVGSVNIQGNGKVVKK